MSDAPDATPDGETSTTPISDVELRTLVLRARADDDPLLRRLIASYLTLRRVTADVIAFVEAREGGAGVAGVPLLSRARQLAAAAPRR
jgi:hypothetical protein